MTSKQQAHKPSVKRKKAQKHSINRIIKHTSPLTMKRLFYIYALCIVTSAAAASLMVSAQSPQSLPDPFTASQRSAVRFRLYYPTRLPAGYDIDVASVIRTQESIVTMRILNNQSASGSFTITQQALPKDINLEALYGSFQDRSSFRSNLGKATAGTIDAGKTRIVSLISDEKTWILIQAPSAIPLTTLQNSIRHLEASR